MSTHPLSQSVGSKIPWWIGAIVIVCASLMATGAVIALVNPAMLSGPGEQINGTVRVYAGYLFSRNLAIAGMLVGALVTGARRALMSLMALTALIQLLDAGVDCFEERWTVAAGVVVLGALLAAGARRLR